MASIELKNIGKQWGDSIALHDVNLHIPSASFCVLLGPSGCGKSTTLRIIAGLESASAGQVWIDERDVTALPPAQRGIAMVFQNYALFPHLSVADNIQFGLSVRKLALDEQTQRLNEVAQLLGLTTLLQRKPAQLSGGQQQRVALARALVARASVCLMDEPLSNLDAQLRQEMRLELRELQQRLKLTVVYVTHDQAEAMSMADQVVLLNAGQIEQSASPRTMYAQPASNFVAKFIGTPAMNLLQLDAGVIAGSQVHVNRTAHTLGVRPEAITVNAPHASAAQAKITGLEYLGADLVLRCAIGSEFITVRTQGHMSWQLGDEVSLTWQPEDAHFFDAQGHRC